MGKVGKNQLESAFPASTAEDDAGDGCTRLRLIVRLRCVVALLLGVAMLLSVIFWLPPFLRHYGGHKGHSGDPTFTGENERRICFPNFWNPTTGYWFWFFLAFGWLVGVLLLNVVRTCFFANSSIGFPWYPFIICRSWKFYVCDESQFGRWMCVFLDDFFWQLKLKYVVIICSSLNIAYSKKNQKLIRNESRNIK